MYVTNEVQRNEAADLQNDLSQQNRGNVWDLALLTNLVF